MAVKDMPTTLPGGRLSFKGSLAIRDEIKRRGSFHPTLHGCSGDDNDNREGASSSSSSSVAPLLTAKRSLSKLPLVMLPGANTGIRPEVDLETNGKDGGSSSGNGSSRSVEEEAARSWTVYMKFNDSVVADLFAGQLQSTVTCLTCSERYLFSLHYSIYFFNHLYVL